MYLNTKRFMAELNIKLLAIFLIFIGEAVAIYAEIISAKYFSTNPAFLQMFLRGFIIIIFGASLLICGYALGFSAFKNIWIVTAVSITSILIVEPIINYAIFRQLPTAGALIGLILGGVGFIFALFYK